LNQTLASRIDQAVKWLVIAGFLTLPYTHFNWMPDLGLTRPVSIVFFALAFGLVGLQALATNHFNLRVWLAWPKSWTNWPILRWWLYLLGMGLVSAAITPFYGLPKEALTRLLGYLAVFIILFMGAYSLPRYGIKNLASWTVLGYLPALVYALVEIASILGFQAAHQWVLWFRAEFIVPFDWDNRLSLFATESSFVGFQILILVLVLPYVTQKWLKWCGWTLILFCLVFTQSGTVVILLAIYGILWFLFSLKRGILSRMATITTGVGGVTVLAVLLIPQLQLAINKLASTILLIPRMFNMSISFQIRFGYLMNLVYAIGDSHGLGLGIGQYGYFWKDIYLRHINYRQFDVYGEVNHALTNTGGYMKPWSVILGVGADLGLLGLALLIGFFIQIYRQLSEPRHRALFFACLAGLAGAYPIVTPHLWLVLALMAGLGIASRQNKGQA
jgi:hypothetical protein